MLSIREFELVDKENHVVAFPFDLDGGTQGSTMAEATEMAADWLRTEIGYRIANGEPIPEPTLGNDPKRGGKILLVAVDVPTGDAVISAREAAQMLGISKGRVSQLVKRGQLVGIRSGRDMKIPVESVRRRIQSQ